MKDKDLDKIDKYLRNELSPKEFERFEQELKENGMLSSELQWMQQVHAVITEESAQDLKIHLKNMEATQTFEPTRKRSALKIMRILLPLAAAVALLIMVLPNLAKDEENLFQTFFEPYPNVMTEVVRSSSAEQDNLSRSMIGYLQGDYKKAILDLEKLIQSSPNDSLLFYKSIAHLGNDEPKKALDILERNQFSGFEDARQWYQIMALLSLEQYPPAKLLLNQYLEDQRSYNRTAALKLADLLP